MLTIEGSPEYHECLSKGKKICKKNQEIVDRAMISGQRVRSIKGRDLVIVESGEEYENQKLKNLNHTKNSRKKVKH